MTKEIEALKRDYERRAEIIEYLINRLNDFSIKIHDKPVQEYIDKVLEDVSKNEKGSELLVDLTLFDKVYKMEKDIFEREEAICDLMHTIHQISPYIKLDEITDEQIKKNLEYALSGGFEHFYKRGIDKPVSEK